MFKKVILYLSLFSMLLLTSCENLIIPSDNGELAFRIGDNIKDEISNSEILEHTFEIVLDFAGSDREKQIFKVKNNELNSLKLNIKKVPFNKDFKILVDVKYNNKTIYQGSTDKLLLRGKESGKEIDVTVKRRKSTITYKVLEDTTLPDDAKFDYFIEDDLPVDVGKIIPIRPGFDFLGWYSTPELNKDDKVEILGKDNYLGDVALYPKWHKNITYTITFDNKEKGICPEPMTVTEKSVITLPVLNETGCKFLGWTPDFETKTPLYDSDFSYTVTKNEKLFAVWNEISILPNVKFKCNENQITTNNFEVDYLDELILENEVPGTTIKYKVNPDTSIIDDKTYEKAIPIDDNVVIEAWATKTGRTPSNHIKVTFNIKKYTVTFNCNGHGTTPATINNLKRGDILTAEQLSSIEDKNFRFDGWFDEKDNKIEADHEITENLNLTARWTDKATFKLNNIKAIPFNNSITIKYTTPENNEYSKTIISGNNISDKTYAHGSNENVEDQIDNLTKGTEYTFTITAYNKDNQVMDTRSIIANAVEIPDFAFLPVGTDGTRGPTGRYVEFGYYPQSKETNTNIVSTASETIVIDGFTRYKGTDGNEYYYEEVNCVLHKGSYFYKREPIKWCIITDNYRNSGKLLVAERCMYSGAFNWYDEGATPNNNYKDCQIRGNLNGINGFDNKGFLQKAFSASARNKINSTSIGDLGINDKLFILSSTEVGDNNNLGFTQENRKRSDTTFCDESKDLSDEYWLWDKINGTTNKVFTVESGGKLWNEDIKTIESVVPALCISF